MSDPKREDLRVWTQQPDIIREVPNAELEAMGYVNVNKHVCDHLAEQLTDWERLGVKVWEDCPICEGQGVRMSSCWEEHDAGRKRIRCGINHHELFDCPDCGGSGKVPADGVQQAANGWWIAPYKMERR